MHRSDHILTFLGVIVACSSACDRRDEQPAQGALTAETRAIVLERLGSLPATPPRDPSNLHADDAAAAALGQQLFFDPRYSSTGAVACATCHDPATGFQDRRAVTSIGVAGFTGRHAPSVLNVAFAAGDPGGTVWNFWDGRKDSLWSQALGPPENPVEMGSTRTRVALLIADHYRDEYEAVFGPLPALRDETGAALHDESAMPGAPAWGALSDADRDAITAVYVNFGKAIAAYERRLVSRASRFDRFYDELAAGAADSDALDADEKLGLAVFVGKGGCVECHGGPNFSDWKFYNIGVAQRGEHVPESDAGREDGVAKVKGDEFNCQSPWSDAPDKGACAVATLAATDSDRGAFRTPTLRDIARTGPYLHTGDLATLAEVVDLYDRGGEEKGFAGTIDAKIAPLGLTDAEKAGLVAFLGALTGAPLDTRLTAAPAVPQ